MTGSRNIAGSGRSGSIASTIICRRCKRSKKPQAATQTARRRNVAARNSIDLDSDPRSIIGTRVFDAPRELVFAAFTDPKHLAQWWGPNGFTTTTHSFDFRPGGVWRFVMHGPDGRDYQNRVTYDEIVPPERIVYRHGGGDDVEPVQFTQTLTFEDLGNGQTRLIWHGTLPVGRRTRARDQGIRRRQGPGADHGAAGRIRGGDGEQSRHGARAIASMMSTMSPPCGTTDRSRASRQRPQRAAQRIRRAVISSFSVAAWVSFQTGNALLSSARPAGVMTSGGCGGPPCRPSPSAARAAPAA